MLKKSILLFVCLLSLRVSVPAQTIPFISGVTANDQPVRLPDAVKGKYAVLCFASSKDAQKDLETWMEPVYNHYIAKTGIMDDAFDVEVYFIPVFKGANAAMMESLKRRFRETAQQDLWPHVLFSKQDMKGILQDLKISDERVPYFFLLDKEGKIAYRTSGAYSEEKFDQLDDKIE